MIPCIVIGDSIAAGVGQYRTDCETVAKVGITSDKYVATLLPSVPTETGTAVISLGVNDSADEPTLDNLRRVRSSFRARQVIWLLPGIKPEVQRLIRQVAFENHDRWIDTASLAGPDHLHPTGQGYQQLAGETANAMPYSLLPAGLSEHRATTQPNHSVPTAYPLRMVSSSLPVGLSERRATPQNGHPMPTVYSLRMASSVFPVMLNSQRGTMQINRTGQRCAGYETKLEGNAPSRVLHQHVGKIC